MVISRRHTPKIAAISSSGTPQVSGKNNRMQTAITKAGIMKQR
jgi:hypothetical protein